MTTTYHKGSPATQGHTPGPFHVETEYPYSGNKPRDFICVMDEAGDELARLHPNTPRSIALANATLFAAAPEMKKMLQRLIGAYELDNQGDEKRPAVLTREGRAMLAQARTLIE